jgi:hypothetical protein
MSVVVVLALLAVTAWLICASVIRMAVAGGVVAITHTAPPLALAVVLAIVLAAVAVAIVWRALAPCGWRLIVTTPRPRPVPTTA